MKAWPRPAAIRGLEEGDQGSARVPVHWAAMLVPFPRVVHPKPVGLWSQSTGPMGHPGEFRVRHFLEGELGVDGRGRRLPWDHRPPLLRRRSVDAVRESGFDRVRDVIAGRCRPSAFAWRNALVAYDGSAGVPSRDVRRGGSGERLPGNGLTGTSSRVVLQHLQDLGLERLRNFMCMWAKIDLLKIHSEVRYRSQCGPHELPNRNATSDSISPDNGDSETLSLLLLCDLHDVAVGVEGHLLGRARVGFQPEEQGVKNAVDREVAGRRTERVSVPYKARVHDPLMSYLVDAGPPPSLVDREQNVAVRLPACECSVLGRVLTEHRTDGSVRAREQGRVSVEDNDLGVEALMSHNKQLVRVSVQITTADHSARGRRTQRRPD